MKLLHKYSTLLLLILNIMPLILFRFEPIYNSSRIITEDIKDPVVSDVLVGNYTVPGVSGPLSLDQLIKIGILDDLNSISGEHTRNGALLAAKEINSAGGIDINGSQHYVGIVAENTEEANPILIVTKGIQAAERMISFHNPYFIIGGYRTESLRDYIEVVMDAKKVFLGTGAAADYFCYNVYGEAYSSYSRYKYWFRVMPLNSTSRGSELLTYLITLSAALGAEYNGTVNKVAILREARDWTIPLDNALQVILPLYGLTIVTDIAFPITATTNDFETYLAQVQALEAQILIPLISGPSSIYMNSAYKNIRPKCLIAGIDELSELASYWDDAQGACQYEVVMQHTYRTNKTDLTIPFWDVYRNEYNKEPFYTGIGAYDAVKLLTFAVAETESFDPDTIVTSLENVDSSDPFKGTSGNIAFSRSHDLTEGWPYNTYLFCQWQLDGIKQVVPSHDIIYPNSIATGPLLVPYWGINNLVEEQPLPGVFTLTSNADNPDTDGNFNLSWTESLRAQSYSLYSSHSPITYIHQNLNLITHQYDNSSYAMANLTTGDYYFIVASYNGSLQTLSNYIHVKVLRPSNEPSIPGYDLFILIGVVSVIIIITERKKWTNPRR